MTTIERKKRKYGIAAQLAQYDEETQRMMINELCNQLGIGKKMLSHYVYVLVEEKKRLNLSTDKLQVIAQFFNVNVSDLLN